MMATYMDVGEKCKIAVKLNSHVVIPNLAYVNSNVKYSRTHFFRHGLNCGNLHMRQPFFSFFFFSTLRSKLFLHLHMRVTLIFFFLRQK